MTNIWEDAVADRTKIPLITHKSMMTKLTRLYDTGIDLGRHYSLTLDHCKVVSYKLNLNKLFDVCSCQCQVITCESARCLKVRCQAIHLDCKCLVKVPERELNFLVDQRGPRRMFIGGLDAKVTGKWKRASTRERTETERYEKLEEQETENVSRNVEAMADFETLDDYETSVTAESSQVDADYVPPAYLKCANKQNRTNPKLSTGV